MNVLDASALISFLRGEPGQREVEAILRAGHAAISAVNLAEVVDLLGRRGGLTAGQIRAGVSGLLADTIAVLACEHEHGQRAGELRAAHYHRRTAALSLADCVALSTAEAVGALVSSDRILLRVAAEQGIGVIAVPDSRGRRPTE